MDTKGKKIVDFGAARKNLKQKAKQDARTEKDRKAEENRVRFGRTGAQKKREKEQIARRKTLLEGHKRENSEKSNLKDSNE